jgi:hypothetical protein
LGAGTEVLGTGAWDGRGTAAWMVSGSEVMEGCEETWG